MGWVASLLGVAPPAPSLAEEMFRGIAERKIAELMDAHAKIFSLREQLAARDAERQAIAEDLRLLLSRGLMWLPPRLAALAAPVPASRPDDEDGA